MGCGEELTCQIVDSSGTPGSREKRERAMELVQGYEGEAAVSCSITPLGEGM